MQLIPACSELTETNLSSPLFSAIFFWIKVQYIQEFGRARYTLDGPGAFIDTIVLWELESQGG